MAKNTVLLFSKLPEVGLVKTRLSVLKDGIFPPEATARLYEAMLLDVVETISSALRELAEESKDSYELVVSVAPAKNAGAMEALLHGAGFCEGLRVIVDEGATFDEHYNHAFQQCWEAGSDFILSMGADMPALTKGDIQFGFQQLHALSAFPGGGIVLAPDQEMGVSVVGWPRTTEFNHSGVYYCQSGLTVLPAYIKKAEEAGLAALWLPPIPDVDTMADLAHNVTLVRALCYCAQFDRGVTAPWRTAATFRDMGIAEINVAPNDLLDPRDAIDA